jgi:hypothetical protein
VVPAGCASRRDRLLTVSQTAVDSLFLSSLVGNLVAAGSHDAVGAVTIIIIIGWWQTAVDSLFPWSLVGNLVAAGSHDAVGGVTIIIWVFHAAACTLLCPLSLSRLRVKFTRLRLLSL